MCFFFIKNRIAVPSRDQSVHLNHIANGRVEDIPWKWIQKMQKKLMFEKIKTCNNMVSTYSISEHRFQLRIYSKLSLVAFHSLDDV